MDVFKRDFTNILGSFEHTFSKVRNVQNILIEVFHNFGIVCTSDTLCAPVLTIDRLAMLFAKMLQS